MSQNSARCCNPDYRKEKLRLWPRQQRSTPFTFTATYFSLNFCLVTCTCARFVTPIGLGSNSSKNSLHPCHLGNVSGHPHTLLARTDPVKASLYRSIPLEVPWARTCAAQVLWRSLGTTNWYESERRVRSSMYDSTCHHSSRTVNFGRDQFHIWSIGQRHQDVCLWKIIVARAEKDNNVLDS